MTFEDIIGTRAEREWLAAVRKLGREVGRLADVLERRTAPGVCEIRSVFYEQEDRSAAVSFPLEEAEARGEPDAWGLYQRRPDGTLLWLRDYPSLPDARRALAEIDPKPP